MKDVCGNMRFIDSTLTKRLQLMIRRLDGSFGAACTFRLKFLSIEAAYKYKNSLMKQVSESSLALLIPISHVT